MQTVVVCLGICALIVPYVSALLNPSDQPKNLSHCYWRMQKRGAVLTRVAAGATQSHCDTHYVWSAGLNVNYQANEAAKAYITGAVLHVKRDIQNYNHRRFKRQANRMGPKPKKRMRKEIRMLSDKERDLLFAGINSMKKNTTVSPNKYEALAEFHTGVTSLSAHGGCNFPGWHRVYLLMFENAIRDEGPEYADVTLPYWDSRLDSRMDVTKDTALFSDRLMGGCQGEAKGGIMGTGWDSSTGVITRNCGTDGPLFTDEQVYNVTRRTRMDEICGMDSEIEDDLEFHHNGGHRFIDGQMAQLSTAPQDPIFWLHHCFVDMVWEMFWRNTRSKRNGVDLEKEFPANPAVMGDDDLHRANASMGFADLKVIDGLSRMFTEDIYDYISPPICEAVKQGCGSKYLKCVVDRPGIGPARRARCVARTLEEVIEWEEEQKKPKPCVTPTPITTPQPPIIVPTKPKPPPKITPVQNTFCMNGKSDSGQWVYIPVKIIVQRPPDYQSYGSYPVERGKIQKARGDIYSPSAYSNVYQHLRKAKFPAKYDGCEEADTPTNTIYVKSVGMNYEGLYKEYAIIDRRLALTVATAYVAVRKPLGINDASVAILHAQDSCGRVCKPICKVPGTEIFRPCSGAVRITGGQPLQFGNSFGDAVLNIWDFNQDKNCPQLTTTSIIMSFYCDYKTDWVWPTLQPDAAPSPPPAKAKPGCALGYGCTIAKPCNAIATCKNGEILECLKSCHKFARCLNNSFYIHQCSRGQKYTHGVGCRRGRCNYRTSGIL